MPPEYQALASIIQYHDEPCEIVVAETMLLSHEARLDRSTRVISHGSPSVNLTQGMIPQAQDSPTSIVSDPTPQLSVSDPPPHFDGNRGGRGSRFSRGGGRNGGRSKVQCQICAKTGHDAKVCYYRLNVTPTGPNQWRNPVIQPQPTSNFQNPWYSAGVSPQMPQQWMSPSQSGFIPRPANSPFAGRQPQAYLAGTDTGTSQAANSQWYADSGATHHIPTLQNTSLTAFPPQELTKSCLVMVKVCLSLQLVTLLFHLHTNHMSHSH